MDQDQIIWLHKVVFSPFELLSLSEYQTFVKQILQILDTCRLAEVCTFIKILQKSSSLQWHRRRLLYLILLDIWILRRLQSQDGTTLVREETTMFYLDRYLDVQQLFKQSSVSPFEEVFSIRVDGSGQFILSYYEGSLKTFYTSIFMPSDLEYGGWTYFALSLNQYMTTSSGTNQYFNDLTLYVGNEGFDSTDQNGYGFYARIKKFQTTWMRSVSNLISDVAAAYPNTRLMIGCRQYEGSASPEFFIGFMHGFFHSLRLYSQAVGLEFLSQDWTSDCNGQCEFCSSIDKKCSDKLEDNFLAKIDFAQTLSNLRVSDSSGGINQLTVSTSSIIKIPEQGILFKRGQYATQSELNYFLIPDLQIFCIESWFKLDAFNPNPDNFVGYLFAKYDSVNQVNQAHCFIEPYLQKYLLAIGIANDFLRVIFGDDYFDVPYTFKDLKWHFVHACFRKSETTLNTQLFLWIDDKQGAISKDFFSVFTDSNTYDVYVGKDLGGIMRTLAISQNIDWDCRNEDNIRSPHIISNREYAIAMKANSSQIAVQSMCSAYGSTSICDYCSPIQYPQQTATSQCFSDCSQNSYDKWCSQCDYRCKYCTDQSLVRCQECNELNFAFQNSTGLCQCAPGYFTNDTKKECTKCNEVCALCDNSTNICLACAKGAYRIYNNQCVKQCPPGYYGNDTYGICMYSRVLIPSPDKDLGCQPEEYYDKVTRSCEKCDWTCSSCNGEYSFNCLSCPRGRYLSKSANNFNLTECLLCDAVGDGALYYGLSGQCREVCGDGKDYGMNECEDGNTRNGDGCSSSCKVEPNWNCNRGTKTKPGTCAPIPSTVQQVNLTSDNNLIVKFSDDIMILGDLSNQDLRVLIYPLANPNQNASGNATTNFTSQIEWLLPDETFKLLPSKVFYLKLDQKQLQSAVQESQTNQVTYRLSVIYQGTGKLRDPRNAELNALQFQSCYLSYQIIQDSDQQQEEQTTCRTVGQAAGSIALAAIFINMLSYLMTNKSVIPAYYSFISLQSLLLILIAKNASYSSCIFSFLRTFDFTLFEFKFIPIFLKDNIIDSYIPRRGIFPEELEASLGLYYNSISYNIFRKIVLWLVYFLVLFPLSGLLKLIFRSESDALAAWPDKFFFSGTMILFFAMIQPLLVPAIAEIQLGKQGSDYELASFSMACLIIVVISVSNLNNFILILRHSSISDHPLIQLRFNTLFTAFKQNNMFAHIFFPVLLSAKIVLVYTLQCTTNFTFITCIIISGVLILYYVAARPFRFKSNTLFVIISELFMIAVWGTLLVYDSNDYKRNSIKVKDIALMTIISLGSACSLAWIIYDSLISLHRWKKLRDQGRANPFHLIPSYKYKNDTNLNTTSAIILDKAVKNINFNEGIDDSRATQDNSDGGKAKQLAKLGQHLKDLEHFKNEEVDPSYLQDRDKQYIDLDQIYDKARKSKVKDADGNDVANEEYSQVQSDYLRPSVTPNDNNSFTHLGIDKRRKERTNSLGNATQVKSKANSKRDFQAISNKIQDFEDVDLFNNPNGLNKLQEKKNN